MNPMQFQMASVYGYHSHNKLYRAQDRHQIYSDREIFIPQIFINVRKLFKKNTSYKHQYL